MVIYCTTNLITYQKYIGYDTHNNPNYLGSGTRITNAIKKYGRQNFKKQILEKSTDFESLLEAEKYWINYFNATKSDLFYNITEGGSGVMIINHPDKDKIVVKKVEKFKQTLKENPEIKLQAEIKKQQTLKDNPKIRDSYNIAKIGVLRTKEERQNISKGKKGKPSPYKGIIGRYSKEVIEQMSLKKKGKRFSKEDKEIRRNKRPLLTCIHCQYQSYSAGNMGRYHFDNCKIINPNRSTNQGKRYNRIKPAWNKGLKRKS